MKEMRELLQAIEAKRDKQWHEMERRMEVMSEEVRVLRERDGKEMKEQVAKVVEERMPQECGSRWQLSGGNSSRRRPKGWWREKCRSRVRLCSHMCKTS